MYVADWDLRIASLRATLPSNWLDRIDVDSYRDVSIGGVQSDRGRRKELIVCFRSKEVIDG